MNEIILTFVVKITEVPVKSTRGDKKLLYYYDQPSTAIHENFTPRWPKKKLLTEGKWKKEPFSDGDDNDSSE